MKTTMQIELKRTGGGPNPDTDDSFTLTVNGEYLAGYATRGDVLRFVNQKLEKAMTELRFA